MIVFKKVIMKNFYSVGNKSVEIDLDKHKITVVSGKNGSGKSAIILDSIFFCLYGKSFRRVNLGNMINSINNKKMEHELYFQNGPNTYKIRRGLKPNYFEIYINGILKPLPANLKDYQTFLTTNILKMDEKTFKQLVIIGSTSYVPFMRLSLGERRIVIDDLLRLDLFSSMLWNAKQLNSSAEADYNSTSNSIDNLKTKVKYKKQSSEDVVSNLKSNITDIESSIESLKEKTVDLQTKKESCLNEFQTDVITNLQKTIKTLSKSIPELQILKSKKQSSIDANRSIIDFFEAHDICPTCTQQISDDKKSEQVSTAKQKEEKYLSELVLFNDKIDELSKQKESQMEELKAFRSKYTEIESINNQIKSINDQIKLLDKQHGSLRSKLETALNTTEENITEILNEISSYEDLLNQSNKRLTAIKTIIALLKDDGVKSIIIKNYIPIINALVKKYLDVIGFNVGFEFNEQFSEIIRSRGRDIFEYDNFSEGEKIRLDHAILFAFRELSRLRSSIHTNLLIFDESDKGTLDTDGFTAIKDIISTCTDENIILISHSPENFMDIADRSINVNKKNNFSMLEISEH